MHALDRNEAEGLTTLLQGGLLLDDAIVTDHLLSLAVLLHNRRGQIKFSIVLLIIPNIGDDEEGEILLATKYIKGCTQRRDQ